MSQLDGHRTAERRSLAYHRRVAEKLRADPKLIEVARARLSRMECPNAYALGWLELLSGPVQALLQFMEEDTQKARDYRQSSPLAGLLPPRERWQLWRETR